VRGLHVFTGLRCGGMRRGRSLVGGDWTTTGGGGGGEGRRGSGGLGRCGGCERVRDILLLGFTLSCTRTLLFAVRVVRQVVVCFFFRSFLCFWEGKTTRSFCVVLDPSLVFHFWIAETAKWRNNVAGTSK
jgi:hypothetical protein